MNVKILETYGPFRKDKIIRVVREGRDFYTLRTKGTIYHVPKSVCSKPY